MIKKLCTILLLAAFVAPAWAQQTRGDKEGVVFAPRKGQWQVSMVIYTQIAIFINTYYTGKLFHLGYREQLTDFLPYFFMALLANIPTYMLTYTSLSIVTQILLGGLMSLSIYILLLKIKRDDMYLLIEHMLLSYCKRKMAR